MPKIKIKNKEYRVDKYKDELTSKWIDNRLYVVEYYELFDEEEEEERYLTIWSDDSFELLVDRYSVFPIIEGHVSDIIEIKNRGGYVE